MKYTPERISLLKRNTGNRSHSQPSYLRQPCRLVGILHPVHGMLYADCMLFWHLECLHFDLPCLTTEQYYGRLLSHLRNECHLRAESCGNAAVNWNLAHTSVGVGA